MPIYSYMNNKDVGQVIFETEAANILEADSVLQEFDGINPVKSSWIGCRILSDFSFEPPTNEKLFAIELGYYDHPRDPEL